MIPIAGEEPIVDVRLVDPGALPPAPPILSEGHDRDPRKSAFATTDPRTPHFTHAMVVCVLALGLVKLTLFGLGGSTGATIAGITFVLLHWVCIVWGATFIGNLRRDYEPEVIE